MYDEFKANKKNLQTAEFFTFEIAKLLVGVLHNTENIIYQIVMVYPFTRTCRRFNNAKIYVDWRFVNKIKKTHYSL